MELKKIIIIIFNNAITLPRLQNWNKNRHEGYLLIESIRDWQRFPQIPICFSEFLREKKRKKKRKKNFSSHKNKEEWERDWKEKEESEMAMARATSGLAYPERFYAAAAYAGFDGSPTSSGSSKFSNDVALLLYALYQQVLQWMICF